MNEQYILSSKRSDDQYHPDRLVTDPQNDLDDLEYGDAANGEYQLWSYPSGVIYEITPDRQVEEKAQFSTPSNKKSEVWNPVLSEMGRDSEMIAKAYKDLTKQDN